MESLNSDVCMNWTDKLLKRKVVLAVGLGILMFVVLLLLSSSQSQAAHYDWAGGHTIDGVEETYLPGDTISAGGDVIIQNGGILNLNGATLNFTVDNTYLRVGTGIPTGVLNVTNNATITSDALGSIQYYLIVNDGSEFRVINSQVRNHWYIDLNEGAQYTIDHARINNATWHGIMLDVDNSKITNTTIENIGHRGIHIETVDGFTLDNCSIKNVGLDDDVHAGIHVYGASSNIMIRDSVLDVNSRYGIYIENTMNPGFLTLDHVDILNYNTSLGMGFHNFNALPDTDVTFSNVTVSMQVGSDADSGIDMNGNIKSVLFDNVTVGNPDDDADQYGIIIGGVVGVGIIERLDAKNVEVFGYQHGMFITGSNIITPSFNFWDIDIHDLYNSMYGLYVDSVTGSWANFTRVNVYDIAGPSNAYGFGFLTGGFVTMKDFWVHNVSGRGVYLEVSGDFSPKNLTVTNNGYYGLYVSGITSGTFDETVNTSSNQREGMWFLDADNILIHNATIEHNGNVSSTSGIRFQRSAGAMGNITLRDLTLEDNGMHGVYIQGTLTPGTLTMERINILNYTEDQGRGIHGQNSMPDTDVLLSDLIISPKVGSNTRNGILFNIDVKSMLLDNVTVGNPFAAARDTGIDIGGIHEWFAAKNVHIYNFAGGLKVTGKGGLGIKQSFDIFDLNVHDIYSGSTAGGYGFYLVCQDGGWVNLTRVHVENLTYSSSFSYGIAVNYNTVADISIALEDISINDTSATSTAYGLWLESTGNLFMSNVTATNNTGTGIRIRRVSSGTIEDSRFMFHGSIGSSRGMYLDLCDNLTIHDVTVSESGAEGIYLESCENVTIHNSTITNNGWTGLDPGLYLNHGSGTMGNITIRDVLMDNNYKGIDISGTLDPGTFIMEHVQILNYGTRGLESDDLHDTNVVLSNVTISMKTGASASYGIFINGDVKTILMDNITVGNPDDYATNYGITIGSISGTGIVEWAIVRNVEVYGYYYGMLLGSGSENVSFDIWDLTIHNISQSSLTYGLYIKSDMGGWANLTRVKILDIPCTSNSYGVYLAPGATTSLTVNARDITISNMSSGRGLGISVGYESLIENLAVSDIGGASSWGIIIKEAVGGPLTFLKPTIDNIYGGFYGDGPLDNVWLVNGTFSSIGNRNYYLQASNEHVISLNTTLDDSATNPNYIGNPATSNLTIAWYCNLFIVNTMTDMVPYYPVNIAFNDTFGANHLTRSNFVNGYLNWTILIEEVIGNNSIVYNPFTIESWDADLRNGITANMTESRWYVIPMSPVLDYIQIVSTEGTGVVVIPDQIVPVGFTITGYAAIYNDTVGYMFDVNANWTVEGTAGANTVPLDGMNSTFNAGTVGGTAYWNASYYDGKMWYNYTITFTVLTPTVDCILIVDSEGTGTAEIPDQNVDVGVTIPGYAAGFNNSIGYFDDVSVSWYVIPSGVEDASSNPSSGNSSDFYSGTIMGAVVWTADFGGGITDVVNFTIGIQTDYILITDSPNMGAIDIPDQNINIGMVVTGYAVAYNNTWGYLWTVPVTWSVNNVGGANASTNPTTSTDNSDFYSGFFGGTATWQASYYDPSKGVWFNDTVILTINPPSVDSIMIVDTEGTGSAEIADQAVDAGFVILTWAAAFNDTIGYISDVTVIWTLDNASGATAFIDLLSGMNTTFNSGLTEGDSTLTANLTGITDTVVFTIDIVYTIDYIRIVDTPDTGITEIADQTVDVDFSIAGYAASFNDTAGYLGDVSVDWSVDAVGTTTPGSGLTSTFDAGLAGGTATWQASYYDVSKGVWFNDTVTYTVNPPSLDYITITDAPDGLEMVTVDLQIGESVAAYASGYNSVVGYLGLVEVDWGELQGLGSFDNDTWTNTIFTAITSGLTTISANNFTYGLNDDFAVDIAPLTVDYILITDAPNGTELGTVYINFQGKVTAYASGYNDTFGFVDLVEVDWSDVPDLGIFNNDTGTNTVFTAGIIDETTTITGQNITLVVSDTFVIVINPPTPDYILITDAPDGTELTITDINSGEQVTAYASGYNSTWLMYVGLVDVEWTDFPDLGSFDNDTGTNTVFTAGMVGGTTTITGLNDTMIVTDAFVIDIVTPTVDFILLTDAPNGNELTTVDINIGGQVIIYASGYNNSDPTYISLIEVDWSNAPDLGTFDNDTWINTVFTAGHARGSVTLTGQNGTLGLLDTFIINIVEPTVDYITITDSPDGTELTLVDVDIGGEVTAYASGYNNTGSTYVGLVELAWTADPVLGVFDNDTGTNTVFWAGNIVGTTTITGNNAALGLSDTFDVTIVVPAVDYILIVEDLDGVVISDQSVPIGFSILGYVAAYNDSSGYITIVDVTWTVSNSGEAAASTTDGTGTSDTFSAGLSAGTGTWTADDGSGHTDTVVFTIIPPTVDSITITDIDENVVSDLTLKEKETFTIYAIGFNITAGEIGFVTVSWSIDGGATSSNTSGISTTIKAGDKSGSYTVSAEYNDLTTTLDLFVEEEPEEVFPWWIFIILAIIVLFILLFLLKRNKQSEEKLPVEASAETAPINTEVVLNILEEENGWDEERLEKAKRTMERINKLRGEK